MIKCDTHIEFGSLVNRVSKGVSAISENTWVIELEDIEKESGRLRYHRIESGINSTKSVFTCEDVLYSKLRPYLKKYFLPHSNGICTSELWVIRPNKKISREYIFYLMQSPYFTRLTGVSSGSKMPRASWNYVKQSEVPIHSDENVRLKICKTFDFVDQKITLLRKKKEAFEAYKKGLVQKIFSQELRFKREDGTDYPDWMSIKLKDVLEEYILKTTINDQHPILSSTNSGLYLQSDYFRHQVASKDNVGYKVIRAGMVVLSPQNLWMGNININQEFEVGIVSPSYKIFKHSFYDDTIAKEWLINSRMLFNYMLASEQGASIVRRNLSLTDFYDIRISIPSNSDEMSRISKVISSLDIEISNLTKKLEKSTKLKQGLLQQMFV